MVGAVIAGKYRIESLIGSGGMANVYKAYDEQEGRTVAIKMLKAEHRRIRNSCAVSSGRQRQS